MGFPRKEYWTELPCPPLGDLRNPRLEPVSPKSPALGGGFFTTSPTLEALPIVIDVPFCVTIFFSLNLIIMCWGESH